MEIYFFLGISLVLLVAFIVTVRKVRNGSKSGFAYVLLLFTLGYSINYAVYYMTLTGSNYTSSEISDYFYFLLTVQVWVFSIKYFKSGQQSKQNGSSLTNRQWETLKYSVIVCYTICMFVLCSVDLISYPGNPS